MISISSKKYFYEKTTVYFFCKQKGIPYSYVCRSIYYYLHKDDCFDLDKIIELVIDRYLKLKEIKRVKKAFLYMEKENKLNISYITRELNFNYMALMKIKRFNFTDKQAIKILWFLADKNDSKGRLSITLKRLKKIKTLLESDNFLENDLLYLVCFIKIGYKKYYDDFLKVRENYLTKLIYKYLRIFNVSNDFFYDLYQDLVIKQIKIFSNCYSRNVLQIVRYFDLCLKGYLIGRLKEIKKDSCLSLFANKFENVRYIDVISNEYL